MESCNGVHITLPRLRAGAQKREGRHGTSVVCRLPNTPPSSCCRPAGLPLRMAMRPSESSRFTASRRLVPMRRVGSTTRPGMSTTFLALNCCATPCRDLGPLFHLPPGLASSGFAATGSFVLPDDDPSQVTMIPLFIIAAGPHLWPLAPVSPAPIPSLCCAFHTIPPSFDGAHHGANEFTIMWRITYPGQAGVGRRLSLQAPGTTIWAR